VRQRLRELLEQSYRELHPGSRAPELEVEFFPFTDINHTIRLRQGRLLVRVSDLLAGAPDYVLRAMAHILLAKMYRKPVDDLEAARYRAYVSTRKMRQKARLARQARGRKPIRSPRGRVYDLELVFNELNQRFFAGLLRRPRLSWSSQGARSRLGHYDPAHDAIVVSRAFDDRRVPRYAIEYIVYHEMLHLKHPIRVRGGRRSLHSPEFRREEKMFLQLAEAKRFLKHL
jgi:hypothetical protein